jgi:hypothetical protein
MKTIDELNKMTVKELIKYCKDNGISNYSNKKKSLLIDLLLDKQESYNKEKIIIKNQN